MTPAAVAGATLVVVAVLMAGEAWLSRRHERALRARGFVEPPGDVYAAMVLAYPVCFLLMALEGAWRGTAAGPVWTAGAVVFVAAKGLKYWAVAALGVRWTFRVLVAPGAPLVSSGPYRLLRHPNYAAVVGELVGMGLMMAAPLSGALAVLGFGGLMRRRVRVEERALGKTR